MQQIDSKGNQVFNIPNNDDGKRFMADIAKYLNRSKYSLKLRGRGSQGRERNANGTLTYNGQSHCKLPNADWVAAYIGGAAVDGIQRDYYATERATRLQAEVNELKAQLALAVESAKACS